MGEFANTWKHVLGNRGSSVTGYSRQLLLKCNKTNSVALSWLIPTGSTIRHPGLTVLHPNCSTIVDQLTGNFSWTFSLQTPPRSPPKKNIRQFMEPVLRCVLGTHTINAPLQTNACKSPKSGNFRERKTAPKRFT